MVMEIENITLFGAFVGAACLGIGHHFRDAWEFFDKGSVVASGNHAFAIYINDIISHHLAETHLS